MVLKHHSNFRCLPIPMRNMPASSYVLSMLLKHLVKCIFPQGSWVELALPQSIRDQQGVHSPLGSEQVVLHSRVSILTISLLSRALQSVSSNVPHLVERPGYQSAWHASNSSQRNIVHRRRAFPLQFHSLDLQVHLITTTLSENTSHWVNGIQALQWLEVWIQFWHSSQLANLYCFSSCTDETHQKSQHTMNSVRVGRCTIVLLSMSRYHKTQGEYSIGFLARQ